jgi:hypothetical protein
MSDMARLRVFPRPCIGFTQWSGRLVMSSRTDARSRSFRTLLRGRWDNFAGTPPGDLFASLLAIAMMFGAMFGCAFAILLGLDGLQLILRPH